MESVKTHLIPSGEDSAIWDDDYERFLEQEVGHKNFTTMGQIYSQVIENSKNLEYGGKTVDAMPYVPEEAIRRIKRAAEGYNIILIELGGTAGEYQNIIYYEAYRILKLREPKNVIHIHVTYFPKPPHINELKSKPTQISVKLLNGMGIQPDFIIGRAEEELDDKRKEKVAYYCNLATEDIISNPDCESIYQIPLVFKKQALDAKVLRKLNLPVKQSKTGLKSWEKLVKDILSPKKKTISVAIIAKYISTGDYELQDSYHSLIESLKHAAWHHQVNLNLLFINAEELETHPQKALAKLRKAGGVIVPIGWGERGVEGKIAAIKYARENKVPYLGLCYGMQLACVEFARNVLGLTDANSTEVNPETTHPIIHEIPFNEKYQRIKGEGASMRLGAYDCVLKPGTLAAKVYGKLKISERHRHRFEFNNFYRQALEEKGLIISGTSPDDFFVEMIELSQKVHPFFLATQAHPEYKSKPLTPHPVFVEYLRAVKNS